MLYPYIAFLLVLGVLGNETFSRQAEPLEQTSDSTKDVRPYHLQFSSLIPGAKLVQIRFVFSSTNHNLLQPL